MRPADTPADDADGRVRVLVLGGWSPGPLDFLRERFANECVFLEPALHMLRAPNDCSRFDLD